MGIYIYSIYAQHKLIALHPWTSDPIKQWPPVNFYQLALELLTIPQLKVIIIGSKENLNLSKELFSKLNGNLINLTAKTNLKQLAVILKKM
jgi:ADP-heptose:LPS heptosyltransferase